MLGSIAVLPNLTSLGQRRAVSRVTCIITPKWLSEIGQPDGFADSHAFGERVTLLSAGDWTRAPRASRPRDQTYVRLPALSIAVVYVSRQPNWQSDYYFDAAVQGDHVVP